MVNVFIRRPEMSPQTQPLYRYARRIKPRQNSCPAQVGAKETVDKAESIAKNKAEQTSKRAKARQQVVARDKARLLSCIVPSTGLLLRQICHGALKRRRTKFLPVVGLK